MTYASCAPWWVTVSRMAALFCSCIRARIHLLGPAWVRGQSMGWERRTRTYPAYLTLKPGLSHGGAKNWSSGFLPAAYQGTAVGHGGMSIDELGEPIEHLKNKTLSVEQQRYELDMLQQMNRQSADRWNHDPEFEARIQAFELAFRMQTRRPKPSIFPGNRKPRKNCTASIVRKPAILAGSA